jgi:ATP-dependent protease ClpP protease subunit
MNPQIKIKNEVDTTTIDIEGTIGLSEAWQFDNPESRVATYERFKECVSQIADIRNSHIVVNIRSTGGDVNDAMLIYEALRSTGAKVTTRCYGYTASAATIVAQAASPGCREIAPTALYLIHNSLCSTEGNADELQAEVEMLRQTDRRIAEVYSVNSGRSVDEMLALMAENGGRGRWLSPEEAIAEGLIDGIAGGEKSAEGRTSVAEYARKGVKALLRAIGVDYDDDRPNEADDINYIPRIEVAVLDSSPKASAITLDEGQKGVEQTRLKAVQDPSPLEHTSNSRSRAYERDIQQIKMR